MNQISLDMRKLNPSALLLSASSTRVIQWASDARSLSVSLFRIADQALLSKQTRTARGSIPAMRLRRHVNRIVSKQTEQP